MPTLLNFLVRVFLLAAGLVFVLSLALTFAVMLGLWSLRVLWGRLTGKPVAPFAMRFDASQGFARAWSRQAGPAAQETDEPASRPTARPVRTRSRWDGVSARSATSRSR